ncbi:hypothetical protein THF1C08_320118 [Vibrio jasicida]|uniref:Uncharacterized protein n=1 Tax=Vibrio jasicida TaxID=766224 RepID=A0AAU9QRP3_9VIBR|nr:hypothetical protein THF1C08_320118 [Vibrio jasicida]CAH1597608.1 hypothetical protein THF1A12_320119 [Vibrio jasicida]
MVVLICCEAIRSQFLSHVERTLPRLTYNGVDVAGGSNSSEIEKR